ncbi:MAG: hypothetical protein ACK5M5_14625 [Limnobaculum xujianqingii]
MKRYLMVCFIVLTGCAGQGVNNQWVRAFNELGVTPVFPPREDVYVGGIYLQARSQECEKGEEKSGCQFASVKVATVDKDLLKYLIEDNNKDLPAFKVDPRVCKDVFKEVASADGKTKTLQVKPETLSNCYYDGDITSIKNNYRLKKVGFPDYVVEKNAGGSLGAVLPTAALSRFGVSAKKVDTFSVSVPSAVYYGISQSALLSVFNQKKKPLEFNKKLTYQELSFAALDPTESVKKYIPISSGSLDNLEEVGRNICRSLKGCQLTLVIPTEVYYSSVFDISMSGSFEANGGINESLEKKDGTTQQFKVTTSDNKVNINDIVAGTPMEGFGVAATINYKSDTAVSLKRYYDAPLAIGYRGVIYPVPGGALRSAAMDTSDRPVPAPWIVEFEKGGGHTIQQVIDCDKTPGSCFKLD